MSAMNAMNATSVMNAPAARRPSLFWQLYLKEIRSMRGLVVFAALAFATLFVYLWTRIGVWPGEAIGALSAIPIALLPFWAIWAGFNSLRGEWQDKTVFYWLSLPARGAALLGAKTLGIATAAVVLYLVAGLGFSLFLWTQQIALISPSSAVTNALLEDAVKISILLLMNLVAAALLAQLSYAVGQTVHRLRWLASGATFFGLLWLGGRLSVYLFHALDFLGGIRLMGVNGGPYGPVVTSTAALPVAVPVVIVLGIAVLFAAGAWILEKRAEA